jgi:hypothetical protein
MSEMKRVQWIAFIFAQSYSRIKTMKISIVICFGLLMASTVFAQYSEREASDIQSDPNATNRIILLLDGGVLKNKDFIKREAENISLEDRQILYNSREKGGTAGYVALNTVIGFGVGSFIQGDASSGVVLLLCDVAAISGLATAQSNTMVYLSLGVYALTVIDGVILPICYTHKYNRTLKESLRLDEPASISMRPLILDNGAVGMSVALNY